MGKTVSALLSHYSNAVGHQSLKMLRRDVRVKSRVIPILFPHRKYVRFVFASSDVKPDHTLSSQRDSPRSSCRKPSALSASSEANVRWIARLVKVLRRSRRARPASRAVSSQRRTRVEQESDRRRRGRGIAPRRRRPSSAAPKTLLTSRA
jgi:hypothetical protein